MPPNVDVTRPIVPLQSRSDLEGGFSALQDRTGIVRVRTWGFWSVQISGVFATCVIDVCRAGALPRSLIVDAEELKPLREEGQAALLAMFDAVTAMGIEHVSVFTSSPPTRLMLSRIVKSTTRRGVVELKTSTA